MGDELPRVFLGAGRTAKQISCGRHHACAVLDNAELKCWGFAAYGRTGNERPSHDTSYIGSKPGEMESLGAVKLGTGRSAKQVSCGGDHTCVVLDDGRIKCFGYGNIGETGTGDTIHVGFLGIGTSSNPFNVKTEHSVGDRLPAVNLGSGLLAKSVHCGFKHTCVVLTDDSVKCFGQGMNGRLGYESTNSMGISPATIGDYLPRVNLGSGLGARCVMSGYSHSCVVTMDNRLKCWGDQNGGKLGTGSSSSHGHAENTMGNALPFVDIGGTPCCPGDPCRTPPPSAPPPGVPPRSPPSPPSSSSWLSEALASAQTVAKDLSAGNMTIAATTAVLSAVMTTAIITSTTAAVGSSIAASVTASATSALAVSTTSSAAATSASLSGSAVGTVMPLIFSAQRFVISSGSVPVGEANEMQSSIIGSLSWITGEFGSLGPSPESFIVATDTPANSSSRRLGEVCPPSLLHAKAVSKISTLMINMVIGCGILAALHIVALLAYRHIVNRRYFQENPEQSAAITSFSDLSDISIIAKRSSMSASLKSIPAETTPPQDSPQDVGASPIQPSEEKVGVQTKAKAANLEQSNSMKVDKGETMDEGEDEESVKTETLAQKLARETRKPAEFKAYPSLLVFPGIFTLVINFFMLGICSAAMEVFVTAPGCCGPACYWQSVIAIVLLVLHVSLGYAMCLHYDLRFRKRTWQPFEPPDDLKEIEDPIFVLSVLVLRF